MFYIIINIDEGISKNFLINFKNKTSFYYLTKINAKPIFKNLKKNKN